MLQNRNPVSHSGIRIASWVIDIISDHEIGLLGFFGASSDFKRISFSSSVWACSGNGKVASLFIGESFDVPSRLL